MSKILIVPGLNGSGPEHWQTHWEARLPDCVRVMQADWEHPKRAPWMATLLAAVDRNPDSIIVAHSLGCALVANAVKERPCIAVRAALLVSPSDVDGVNPIEDALRDFAPMPLGPFPFRTIVAASENDPYVRIERARFFATEWGAEFIDVGARGHINADSKLGDWPQGLAILRRLTG
ncbi:MAG: alpha/beta hydrolase [Xanthobacteraceae bacterium]